MKTIAYAVSLLLIGATATRLIHPRSTKAQSGCSLSSVQGNYGFAESGFYLASGNLNLVSAAGRAVADGNGNLMAQETLVANGNVVQGYQYFGSYTVNPDCTGSLTTTDGNGNTGHLNFVITSGGATVQMIASDSGYNVTGTAYRQ